MKAPRALVRWPYLGKPRPKPPLGLLGFVFFRWIPINHIGQKDDPEKNNGHRSQDYRIPDHSNFFRRNFKHAAPWLND